MRDQAGHFERLQAGLGSRYRIVQEVGRGGMATVYLALDLKHERQVAVKVLQPELAASIGPERFLREIQIAAVLAHPHILPLHDSGEVDGFIYYVMPFVEGESLRDRLSRERRLPLDDAVRIVREVADGLAYAHRLGFVHRDIKPENILFLGGHAVLADFGIATALGAASGPRLTGTGLALGTPAYMSPEQATGQDIVDGRSDTYGLGCVFYEMLVGEPPFNAPTVHASLARKLSEPAPRLATLLESVPSALEAAVGKALAPLPADRFRTPDEFANAVAQGAAGRPAELSSAKRSPRAAAILAGSVLAIALAGVLWRLQTREVAAGLAADAGNQRARPSVIAVMPFENLGPAEDEYFAAGMTEEIAHRLSAASELGLVSSRSARRYAGSDKTIREIGRELGIDYLLVGSVRWAGTAQDSKSVRVTLELLRTEDERPLWSTTYDRVLDDLFKVQSDIATQVVEKLGITLQEGERSRLRANPTENRNAYTLYLKGRYFWNKRTTGSIDIALDYFQQAVDQDPGYSLAWVGVADVWIFRGWYSHLAPGEAFPKAKQAALKALEFDSTLAEAHASLAHILFEYDHDWAAAEREYRRALELKPTYATAHHWYGGFLSAMGRHDEALRHATQARALDPLSLIIQTWMGLRYYFRRDHDRAIAEYRKALELDSSFAAAHWHLGWAYEQAGRFEEGIAEARQALTLDDQSLLYLASLGHAFAKAGMTKEARATLAQLMRSAETRHVSAYHVAVIHIALGETDRGLDWLDRALQEQSPWVGYLAIDPRLDPVRATARFDKLVKQVGLRSE